MTSTPSTTSKNPTTPTTATTPTTPTTDHQLLRAITDELRCAPNVDADHVAVSANAGAVTISGEVDSYLDRTAALAAVLRVRGVTGVADALVVRRAPGPRADVDVVRDAVTALDRAPAVSRGSVQVTVHDRRLTLSGSVAWNYQRLAAERAVAHVPGVEAVTDLIQLEPTLPFASTEAKDLITAALLRNAQIDADRIHVQTDGTEIRLTGFVRSWAEQQQADHAAWATPGVTDVHNKLRVVS